MPPRNTASKAPSQTAEALSVVDLLGEDAEQVEAPTEYPPGAPEFKVMLAVRPRTKRAEFKRLLAEITERSGTAREQQKLLAKLKGASDDERGAALFRLSASLDEVLEVVESALRLVAVDVEKFDVWAAEVEDEDLQTTWAVYQTRSQPGEAPSSTS
jgi:hypothetical protein